MGCNCHRTNVSPPLTAGKVAHGVVGVAQSVLHINRASDEVIKSRRSICRTCEFSTKNNDPKYKEFNGMTSRSVCTQCHCNISLKTNNKSEECPQKLWGKIQ